MIICSTRVTSIPLVWVSSEAVVVGLGSEPDFSSCDEPQAVNIIAMRETTYNFIVKPDRMLVDFREALLRSAAGIVNINCLEGTSKNNKINPGLFYCLRLSASPTATELKRATRCLVGGWEEK